MVLTSIHLRNFRIHKETLLNFSGNLNYIVGGNGQGKTSILEAIYYLCTTKSNNTKTDSEVVSFNEKEIEIKGLFKDKTEDQVRVFYSLESNKRFYFLNNKQIHRSAEIIGKFPVVILTPADHAITQGPPGERRKFVDSVISQASEIYLKNLLDYNRTLRQRSSFLSQAKEYRKRDILAELDAWTKKLLQSGTELITRRLKFIDEFNHYIMDSFSVIMGDNESPSVSYSYLNEYMGDDIEGRFEELLRENYEEEIRRGTNLIGPHRDDFIFEINGLNLKTFGSQGQHKTFQVVLRFAEFFYLKEICGKNPIFLLDDVFGELDANRAVKISEYLRSVGQAFITITDFANFSFLERKGNDMLIKINNGVVDYA
jgi:DNA replication and repair protein RecF